MTREERLMEKYRPLARPGSREVLLAQREALRFVEDCRRLGLVILGLDFFIETGDGVLPTSGPADFSSLYGKTDAVERSVVEARNLIAERLPDGSDWVLFVVKQPGEPLCPR